MLLFQNQTVDGDSSIIRHNGGTKQFQIDGTFDGATIQIQVRQDSLTFFNLTNGAFTAADLVLVDIEDGADYRVNLSSAGASTDITVSAI